MDLRTLRVHDVGQHPAGASWEGKWRYSITSSIQRIDGDITPVVQVVYLDALFAKYSITVGCVLKAIANLAKSATRTGPRHISLSSAVRSRRLTSAGRQEWSCSSLRIRSCAMVQLGRSIESGSVGPRRQQHSLSLAHGCRDSLADSRGSKQWRNPDQLPSQ